jgi:hypothetical protein
LERYKVLLTGIQKQLTELIAGKLIGEIKGTIWVTSDENEKQIYHSIFEMASRKIYLILILIAGLANKRTIEKLSKRYEKRLV